MNIPKIFERKPKLVSNSVLHIILKRREKIESIRVFLIIVEIFLDHCQMIRIWITTIFRDNRAYIGLTNRIDVVFLEGTKLLYKILPPK